jgi:uncharacterized SAM-binding protein YcdF (DUF218 family)
MFFYLSKILWFFAQPSNALIIASCAGALLVARGRLRRTGAALLAAGLAGLVLAAFSPLGNLAVLPLEERFPQWRETAGPPDGIILLGGSFVTGISAARGTVELNEAAERITAFVTLSRRYPEAELVVTGGTGTLFTGGETEAEAAERLLSALGADTGRVIFENRARNTWENAVFTRDLVSPAAGARWLIVTSAFHMPRSIGTFRAAGFPVEAHPVDYRTGGWQDAMRPFDSASEGLRRTDLAVREWIGLVAYRLTGRSDALLPAP